MSGPWEKYAVASAPAPVVAPEAAVPAEDGPWAKYEQNAPQSSGLGHKAALAAAFGPLGAFAPEEVTRAGKSFLGMPQAAPTSMTERAADFVGKEGLQAGLSTGASILAGTVGPQAALAAGGGAAVGSGIQSAARMIGSKVAPGAGIKAPTAGQALNDAASTAAINTASSLVVPKVLQGAAKLAAPLKRPAVAVGAQIMRALSGIPEKAGKAALNDLSLLSRAATVEDAGAAYAASTGGLESGAKASRASLGKSYFSGEGIADKFDELVKNIDDGSIDDQTLLALRQRTMKAIEDLPFKQRDLRRVLAENIEKMDAVLEQRLPTWAGAKTGYRESKVAEEFSSLLPLNKNLSPNVLRTGFSIAAAAKGLAENKPWLALGLPAVSPAVYGLAIRGANLGAQALGAAAPAAPQAAASLADFYRRQQLAPSR